MRTVTVSEESIANPRRFSHRVARYIEISNSNEWWNCKVIHSTFSFFLPTIEISNNITEESSLANRQGYWKSKQTKHVGLLEILQTTNKSSTVYNNWRTVMNMNKRFKSDPTLLEQLSNELFIEIFRYLNGVDAGYAFSKLNVRFEQMTLDCNCVFDFKSASKAKFDLVTESHNRRRMVSTRPIQCWQFTESNHIFLSTIISRERFYPTAITFAWGNAIQDRRVLLPQLNALVNLVFLSIHSLCGEELASLELPQLKQLTVSNCSFTSWMKVRNNA